MSITRVKVENLSKLYRLGEVGTGTLSHDLNRFWHRIRGKDDPYSIVTSQKIDSKIENEEYLWAIEDINFEVKEGEVLGIIGRNGAGKSTLLKILSKVTGPTKGAIKLNGRVGSLLEVGTGMHPELTGKENVYLNGAILGMSKKEISAKFSEIVEFAGISKFIDTPLKRYSSGMRVRLGFAVAAFLEPEILIVDEVLAVGDSEFQSKAIGKMQDISHEEGRTVLFVSHNMASVSKLCSRSIVLEKGRISFNGSSDKAIEHYLSQYSEDAIDVDLSKRQNRFTQNRFLFTSIDAKDQSGNQVNRFISGNDYSFEVSFKTIVDLKIIGMRMLVVDMSGVNRLLMNGAFVSKFPISLPKKEKNKVKFILPRLPLPEGEYTVQISCYSQNGVEDDIENAFKISCEGGDYFNTGKLPNVKDGLYVPYNFEIE